MLPARAAKLTPTEFAASRHPPPDTATNPVWIGAQVPALVW